MDKRNSDTYYDIEIEFEEALLKSGHADQQRGHGGCP